MKNPKGKRKRKEKEKKKFISTLRNPYFGGNSDSEKELEFSVWRQFENKINIKLSEILLGVWLTYLIYL